MDYKFRENSRFDRGNVYDFVTNTYHGTGGYLDGSYIFRFPAETEEKNRPALAYHKPYVRGVVDSIITPVFSSPPDRTGNISDAAEVFFDDCDLQGNPLEEVVKVASRIELMHGVVFILMDNFSETYERQIDNLAERRLPFIRIFDASQVGYYTTDEVRNLREIAFFDHVNSDGDNIYRFWTRNESVLVKINSDKDDPIEVVGDMVEHGLGVLPVVAQKHSPESTWLPHPPLYDLCNISLTIFNQDSEQRSLERLSAFPMLAIESEGSDDTEIVVGQDSILEYGMGREGTVNRPEWIAPPTDILKVMGERSNDNVAHLLEVANTIGATAVTQGESKSGVAYSYEFLGQNYAMKDRARTANNLEIKIRDLFNAWTGENNDYDTKYTESFEPSRDEIMQRVESLKNLLYDEYGAPLVSEKFNQYLRAEIGENIALLENMDIDENEINDSVKTV
jgi:hypothetical protein